VKGKVLVAGFATRHVVQSAANAGYEVCAVDHFCDQDLWWNTIDREKFCDLADLPDAIHTICKRHTFDHFIVTSGAEELPTVLPLRGTPKDKIARFMDKLDIQYFFKATNVPVPRLLAAGEYPAMVKPRKGAGGWRNTIVRDADEFSAWENLYPGTPFIRQEPVPGVPASVCCVTDGSRARAIAANEQILRGNGESMFGFSGSVTPFDHPLCELMVTRAEQIAAASGCTGTIGIDFVLGDRMAYAIEINPRFQGTIDTVEMAYGCNMFQCHIDACSGKLPQKSFSPLQVAARSILFAERDFTLTADLKHLMPHVADIPWPGTFFEEGQAVVSVYGQGITREGAFLMLDKHISTVRQYIR
jgi:predicted ATP-grasp superfamily ATP-dependent carboligase